MSTQRAFLLHFLASAAVVGTVLALIWFAWYPAPLFKLLGAGDVIKVLVGVDLVLGPALTLLLYRPGKPKLLLDMAVVLAIQLSALTYGVSVIYSERPCYMVYAVDRFEAVSCSQIDANELKANSAVPAKQWQQPLYVQAQMPATAEEMQKLIEEVVLEGKPDISERPARWLPMSDATINDMQRRYGWLGDLPLPESQQAEAQKLLEKFGEQLIVVPLTARDNLTGLVLSAKTRQPVGSLDVDPWELRKNQQQPQPKKTEQGG